MLTSLNRSLAVLAAVAICVGISGTALGKSLTYGSPVPERALFNREGVVPFLDKIAEATEGRVTFRGLFGGAVVKMPTVLSSVRDGVVDSGFVILAFYPSDLPHASLMAETTGLGTDPVASIGALNEVFYTACPSCLDDMKKAGQLPLFLNSTTPLAMQCAAEIASTSELAGKRVSVIGSPEARWAEKIGMTPVRTKISDLLVSLQLGKTDCALVPISWAQSYGLLDVVKTVVDFPQGIPGGAIPVSLSRKAWDTLSAEDKDAIKKISVETVYDYVIKAYVEADAAVRPKLEGKATFIEAGADFTAAWTAYQAAEIKAIEEKAAERGIPDPAGFAEKVAAIYAKWHTQYLPQIKDDPAAFTEILERDVFSKVQF